MMLAYLNGFQIKILTRHIMKKLCFRHHGSILLWPSHAGVKWTLDSSLSFWQGKPDVIIKGRLYCKPALNYFWMLSLSCLIFIRFLVEIQFRKHTFSSLVCWHCPRNSDQILINLHFSCGDICFLCHLRVSSSGYAQNVRCISGYKLLSAAHQQPRFLEYLTSGLKVQGLSGMS